MEESSEHSFCEKEVPKYQVRVPRFLSEEADAKTESTVEELVKEFEEGFVDE